MSDEPSELDAIWEKDHLGRRGDAHYLETYLSKRFAAKPDEPGFVLAVNADWGLGKTFLIQCWHEQLKFGGYPVVHFDAWENDFTSEPLVGFIAELHASLDGYLKEVPKAQLALHEWLDKGKSLIVPSVKVLMGAALKHTIGLGFEVIQDYYADDRDGDLAASQKERKVEAKKLGDDIGKAMEAALKGHIATRKAIRKFRELLAILIEHLKREPGVQLPLFVLVDELDRCRPDYAIKLLEGIKHLFGVPGVYFIISTNITQLSHSVSAVYGAKFDGHRYLKRFFDMEYALPNPDDLLFAKELMAGLIWVPKPSALITGFADFFNDRDPADNLPILFKFYSDTLGLSLRDRVQAARILEASLLALKGRGVHIHFLLFLVVLYQKSPHSYHQITAARTITRGDTWTDLVDAIRPVTVRVPTVNERGKVDGERELQAGEIAEVYFECFDGAFPDGSINTRAFPANLGAHIRDAGSVGMVQAYMDTVKRAGHFSISTEPSV